MSEWDYKIFWDEAVNQFKEELSFPVFSMWFIPAKYEKSTENSVVLTVPSQFFRDQLVTKHKKAIEKKLFELSGKKLSIEFNINKENTANHDETEENAAVSGPISTEKETKKRQKPAKTEDNGRGQHPDLKAEYSFDDFVVGPNNSFAVNAGIAVSTNPGTAYNPMLIYGGVGLGKTHLMQAIGNKIWNNTNLKVIYVTAENFTNEFVECIKKGKMSSFKNKYRNADVLLIDDIHFFQGKVETQEELFHTFNELYEKNKQIVFTCDRPPSELKNLSQRLKSRFERGLNVDLQTPSYEVRYAILLKKMEKHSIKIPNEVINMVAKNISSNVRDLEAALTKLIAYKELTKKTMDEATAKNVLRDIFGSTRQRNVTIDLIQKTVADYFSISISDIKGKKRTKSFSFPRQIAMFLCREMTECSTTELGNDFGGRDHTTILHGCNKIEEQITADPSIEKVIHELMNTIKENTNK
ncbi:chromosomal replication initiator protein DnaA [Treponema putidum]|uniref:Chromosomal replication initiator protein DnaA n=1 Tax=Treponema putidum TaxID=221027 RepID=A0AAE9MQH0_9SPIR|nr:chromosomal replication initiator protein DnaA [Treponema putidum]AIN93722.1 chromosomal replication initiation protein [Treponema putidum]TWI77824.1 chromosomal replication initiator protein [Treponema putidum]UTY27538.1 chromosomal replication initiator protein DnaA [Treponema putidum]UTY30130.1 chromosomal replication initiator protein DnaA [Treponema putidum]UTY32579.1 chromosomal replication initiator protein DnaA [Treponema putidum]